MFRSQDFFWANENQSDSVNDLLEMRSFRFRIGVTEFHTASDLVHVTKQLRDVAKRYPELKIVTYQQSRSIADQVSVKF